ncbi:hypothetical protein D3C79_128570 [compost metagenome]
MFIWFYFFNRCLHLLKASINIGFIYSKNRASAYDFDRAVIVSFILSFSIHQFSNE